MWLNGGKFGNAQIIPPSYVNEAISTQMVIGGGLPSKEFPGIYSAGYGYGWVVQSYKGHYLVWHNGGIDGFTSYVTLFPSDSLGIIVLSNQDGSTLPGTINNIVADKMLGLPYYDWQTYYHTQADSANAQSKRAAAKSMAGPKNNTRPSHDLKDYQGIYNIKGYGSMHVVLQNDSLFILLPQKTWWLRHYHYDYFAIFEKEKHENSYDTSAEPMMLQFNIGVNGDIESASIKFEAGLKPIEFNKIALPKETGKDGLLK